MHPPTNRNRVYLLVCLVLTTFALAWPPLLQAQGTVEELATALNPALTFVAGGSNSWYIGSENDGGDGDDGLAYTYCDSADASGSSTWLETTVVGPGELSFRWGMERDDGYETLSDGSPSLRFFIDGLEQRGALYGETFGLLDRAFTLVHGTHTLRWEARHAAYCEYYATTRIDDIRFFNSDLPRIITQPTSELINRGTTTTLSVEVLGLEPFQYQWYRGQSGDIQFPIEGAVAKSYTTDTLTATTNTFWVRVSNAVGSVDSITGVTRTAVFPVIFKQPQGSTLMRGENGVLQIEATGDTNTYQWYQGAPGDISAPVSGATNRLMVSLPLYETTIFWVRVSTPECSVDSAAAEMVVQQRDDLELNGFGSNYYGEMGIPDSTFRNKPLRLATGVSQISTNASQDGRAHSLFLHSDGTLWASGDNQAGQLCDGTTISRTEAIQVATEVKLAYADQYGSIYIKSDGVAWASGEKWSDEQGSWRYELGVYPIILKSWRFVPVVQVAATRYYLYLLRADGTLWSVRRRFHTVDFIDTPEIERTATGDQIAYGVAQITAGESHCLYVKTDASLWGIGDNRYGQLGLPKTIRSTSNPLRLASDVVQASACLDRSAYLKSDGTLWYCGQYTPPPLPDIGYERYEFSTNTPTRIADDVAKIATGPWHTCYIKRDGSLWTVGTFSGRYSISGSWYTVFGSAIPEKIADFVQQVSTGGIIAFYLQSPSAPVIAEQPASQLINPGTYATLHVTAAPSANSLTYQWYKGQSGDTTHPMLKATSATFSTRRLWETSPFWVRVSNRLGSVDSQTAVITLRGKPVITQQPLNKTIRYGTHTFLTITATGGELSYQWYKGSSGDTSMPVVGATSATLVTPSLYDSASYWVRVVNASGSVESVAATVGISKEGYVLNGMGSNDTNLLSAGWLWSVPTPTQIANGVIQCAQSSYGIAYVTTDNSLWLKGNIGRRVQATPIIAKYASDVVAVGMDSEHINYLTRDNNLLCDWRCNYGDIISVEPPLQIRSKIVSFAVDYNQSYYVDESGVLWSVMLSYSDRECTGQKFFAEPVKVAEGVAQVSSYHGSYYRSGASFVKFDGTLWAMGYFGLRNYSSTPVHIASDVWQVSRDAEHILFVKTDGTLWAMGANDLGQFGNGTTTSSIDPIQVAEGVIFACANYRSSYFIKTDESLWAVGSNDLGQLGDGTFEDRLQPVWIASGVVSVSTSSAGGPELFLQKSPMSSPIIHRPQSTFELWKRSEFTETEQANTTLSAPLADPSGSGLNNLMRYAFQIPRQVSHSPRLPTIGVVELTDPETASHSAHATLIFTVRSDDPDLIWQIESSCDLVNWHYNGDGSGQSPITTTVTDNGDGTSTVVAHDGCSLTADTARYLRVRLMLR